LENEKEIPGAIFIQDADNLVLERNIIRYTGGSGINVDDEYPVKNLWITGNVFYKTASTAINLCRKRFHPPTTEGKSGVYKPLISNNYFYEAAFEYGSNVFAAHYAYQLDFSHNEILDAPIWQSAWGMEALLAICTGTMLNTTSLIPVEWKELIMVFFIPNFNPVVPESLKIGSIIQ
jgi:hypothetical protein